MTGERGGRGRVLVVAAHPDDEVLGCGATIARLAAEGREVHVALFGEGATSRAGSREVADPAEVSALRECAREAALRLGAHPPVFCGLPDNRFDTVALLDVVKLAERLIVELEPEVVYTHHRGDLNVDHRVLHDAVLVATRPLPSCSVREVYAFEVPSSTEWAFGGGLEAFRPNAFVDVGATLGRKLAALEAYAGEMRDFPHPRSAEAVRAGAQRWGSAVGVAAAEAFVLLRSIR